MLSHNKRDWCHFYLDWERPKIIADLDRLIGNKKEHLKFSYLVLTASESRNPSPQFRAGIGTSEHLFRVVSAPLRSKGKIELLLCPAEGNDTGRLHRVTRLDKERGPANADLDRVWRGEIVECHAKGQIAREDHFRIVRSKCAL